MEIMKKDIRKDMTTRVFTVGIALILLGTLGVAQHVSNAQTLGGAVRSSTGKGRTAAMSSLAALGEPAIDELRKLAMGDDRELSFLALQELVNIRNHRVLPILVTWLKQAKAVDISTALLAIGNHGNPKSFDILRPYLADRSPATRLAAAYALGGIGVPEGVPILKRAQRESDASVRWQAMQSIRNIESIMRKYPDRLTKRGWWNPANKE
jgi:HEAT repeat protein